MGTDIFRKYLESLDETNAVNESVKIDKLEDKGYDTIELVDGRDKIKFIMPFDKKDSPSIIINGKVTSVLREDLQKAIKEIQKLI